MAGAPRLVIWSGLDAWRKEDVWVALGPSGVRAEGTQVGLDPLPYRLDYVLEAPEGFVTRSLAVEVGGDGWRRRLRLRHDGAGGWTCEATAEGAVDLAPAGGDPEALAGARDVDLGLSALTNLLPVRRHGLHLAPGAVDLVAAWVSVPDLAVHPSAQRYAHVGRVGEGAVVRYRDRGVHEGFTADLELDTDGLVVTYPGLVRRVSDPEPPRR